MLTRFILRVTKFQLPPPKRLGTVAKNILGGHHAPPPMLNRVKDNGISSKPASSSNSSSRGIDTMGSVDANRTFEIFVKQGDTDFDKRNLADDTGRINEIFQSTGTQTVDST